MQNPWNDFPSVEDEEDDSEAAIPVFDWEWLAEMVRTNESSL